MNRGISTLWRSRPQLAGLVRRPLIPGPLIAGTARNESSTGGQPSREATAVDLRKLRINNNEHKAQSKKWRNASFRNTFRLAADPETQAAIDEKLKSPYAPMARNYPRISQTKYSAKQARIHAGILVAHDRIWTNHNKQAEVKWETTFDLLKTMTRSKQEENQMAAMRIVLPSSLELEEVPNQPVRFIDSSTGILTKLRISSDRHRASAILVRGRRSALAKAADELVSAYQDIQVFQLGEVVTFDYESRQLWPSIHGVEDGESEVPVDQLDKVWIHQEKGEKLDFWIEKRYEDLSRPVEWTTESLQDYISDLSHARLRPGVARQLYRPVSGDRLLGDDDDGNFVIDTDGIKVKLMFDALNEPSARRCIDLPILKMALTFMAFRGGHIATADKLLKLAEDWGVPLNTDIYNIMLQGYVLRRDPNFFHSFLAKMRNRYFFANSRTWLLFLRLTQDDNKRRLVVTAMYERGLFKDEGLRRRLAKIMASQNAYHAFRSGKTMEEFLAEQDSYFSADWFTRGACNEILNEYLRFQDRTIEMSSLRPLLKKQGEDGRHLHISTINIILAHASLTKDWNLTFQALRLLPQFNIAADPITYRHLITLALETSCPTAAAIIFLYGSLKNRFTNYEARQSLHYAMLGTHRNAFWRHNQLPLLDKCMPETCKYYPFEKHLLIHRTEQMIWAAAAGCKPVEPLVVLLEQAWREHDVPMKERKEAAREALRESRIAAARGQVIKDEQKPKKTQKEEPLSVLLRSPRRTEKTFRLDTPVDPYRFIVGYKWMPPRTNRALAEKPESKY